MEALVETGVPRSCLRCARLLTCSRGGRSGQGLSSLSGVSSVRCLEVWAKRTEDERKRVHLSP